jgi:hypothetical protein
MNRHGAAGLRALNPDAVVEFLDAHSAMVPTESGRQTKVLNGYRLNPDDARVIRRWRNQAKGVSVKGMTRMMDRYGLGRIVNFHNWAKRHGYAFEGRQLQGLDK